MRLRGCKRKLLRMLHGEQAGVGGNYDFGGWCRGFYVSMDCPAAVKNQ